MDSQIGYISRDCGRQNGSALQALDEDLVHFSVWNQISLLIVTCGSDLLLESTLIFQMSWCSQWVWFLWKTYLWLLSSYIFWHNYSVDCAESVTLVCCSVPWQQTEGWLVNSAKACDVVGVKLDAGKHHPTLASAPGPTQKHMDQETETTHFKDRGTQKDFPSCGN